MKKTDKITSLENAKQTVTDIRGYTRRLLASFAKKSSDWQRQDDFVRYAVEKDGDCGYTAFGITREYAHELLTLNLDSVKRILAHGVIDALHSDEGFAEYLKQNKLLTEDLGELVEKFRTAEEAEDYDITLELFRDFAQQPNIQQAYIDYDVRDKSIQYGWAHPSTLQALSQIQGIELFIWQPDELGKRQPYPIYNHYQPENYNGEIQRVDLFFVNNNHFERIVLNEQLKQEELAFRSKKAMQSSSTPFQGASSGQAELTAIRQHKDQQAANLTNLVQLLRQLWQDVDKNTSAEAVEVKNKLQTLVDDVDSDREDKFINLIRETINKLTGDGSLTTFLNTKLEPPVFEPEGFAGQFRALVDNIDDRHKQKALINDIKQAFETYHATQKQAVSSSQPHKASSGSQKYQPRKDKKGITVTVDNEVVISDNDTDEYPGAGHPPSYSAVTQTATKELNKKSTQSAQNKLPAEKASKSNTATVEFKNADSYDIFDEDGNSLEAQDELSKGLDEEETTSSNDYIDIYSDKEGGEEGLQTPTVSSQRLPLQKKNWVTEPVKDFTTDSGVDISESPQSSIAPVNYRRNYGTNIVAADRLHDHHHYHSHEVIMPSFPSVGRQAVRDGIIAALVVGAAFGVAGAIFGSVLLMPGGATGGAIGLVIGIAVGICVGLAVGAGVGLGAGAMSYLVRHHTANASMPQMLTRTAQTPLLLQQQLDDDATDNDADLESGVGSTSTVTRVIALPQNPRDQQSGLDEDDNTRSRCNIM